jgi:molecular chaperone GrpE
MKRYKHRREKLLSERLASLKSEMSKIKKELEAEQREKEAQLEQIKRLQADFENYKKREEREKEEFIKYANEKLITQLIDVYENLERGLENCSDCENQELVKGLNMVYRQLKDILTKAGLSEIKAEGEPFDHNLHEALMQTETDEVPEDTVLEELQRGYLLHGKVLRPSKVRIAKSPEKN